MTTSRDQRNYNTIILILIYKKENIKFFIIYKKFKKIKNNKNNIKIKIIKELIYLLNSLKIIII